MAGFEQAPPETAGVFCDFDGTLSRIVADPAEAVAVPGAADALAALAARYGLVAIVSARPLSVLRGQIPIDGLLFAGIHGLEQCRDGVVTVRPDAEALRDDVERAANALDALATPDVQIERKGLAVAVHYRNATDLVEGERIAAEIVDRVAKGSPLMVERGRKVIELRPPGGKGDTVRALIGEFGLKAAAFAGDDVGDIAAFDAVAELPAYARIAVSSPEAPPELLSLADVVVNGPEGVIDWMTKLAQS